MCESSSYNDTATTDSYTLSLHDALPISNAVGIRVGAPGKWPPMAIEMSEQPAADTAHPGIRELQTVSTGRAALLRLDRKSTRLNSSHGYISYAVFCLQKKKYNPHAYLRV